MAFPANCGKPATSIYTSIPDATLMGKGKFEENTNFLRCKEIFDEYLLKEEDNIKFRAFEKKLVKIVPTQPCSYTINDIDLMIGKEFEEFVGELFSRIGYHTKVTQHSYDQGVDVIAERDDVKIGIQAKRYSGNVPNSAIQEIVAGLSFHGCSKGIVVTNNYFTKSARELADSNGIKLWDRKVLEEKIFEYF